MPTQNLGAVRLPVLVLHHERDACRACSPTNWAGSWTASAGAPVKRRLVVTAAKAPAATPARPCTGGYIGMEAEAVAHHRLDQSPAEPAMTITIRRDPRLFQLAFQATLLTLGVLFRDFSLLPAQMAPGHRQRPATQAFWLRRLRLRQVAISARSSRAWGYRCCSGRYPLAPPLVACLAISGKFVLRIRGKHVFNPANFGVGWPALVARGLGFPGAMGQRPGLAVWLVAQGAVVAGRARWDDAAGFLAAPTSASPPCASDSSAIPGNGPGKSGATRRPTAPCCFLPFGDLRPHDPARPPRRPAAPRRPRRLRGRRLAVPYYHPTGHSGRCSSWHPSFPLWDRLLAGPAININGIATRRYKRVEPRKVEWRPMKYQPKANAFAIPVRIYYEDTDAAGSSITPIT